MTLDTLSRMLLPLLADATLKAFLLLALAAAVSLGLRRGSARARSALWGAALAGVVLMPLVAPLLPQVEIPALPSLEQPAESGSLAVSPGAGHRAQRPAPAFGPLQPVPVQADPAARGVAAVTPPDQGARVPWTQWIAVVWLAGLGLAVGGQCLSLWRTHRLGRRARPVSNGSWLRLLGWQARRLGVSRPVDLSLSESVSTPVTWGVWRHRIVLPPHARTWLDERLEVVLLHELAHVARRDWLVRILARLVCAVHWFNPLAWLALSQLAREQELACDRAVLDEGVLPSSYATHLLAVARSVRAHLIPIPAAPGMARRSTLEGRIMTILRPHHTTRTARALSLSAVILVALLVPGIAAVQPWSDPAPTRTPELQEAVDEIVALESEMEPQLERLEAIEIEMEPYLEGIEEAELEIQPHLEEIERAALAPIEEELEVIEAAMEPFLERMAAVEVEMGPFHRHMEKVEIAMQPILAQIEEVELDMAPFHARLEAADLDDPALTAEVHAALEPMHEQVALLHEQLEPLHAQLASVHEQMSPLHERLEGIHGEMAPLHEELTALHGEEFQAHVEQLHARLEPFGERMERLHQEMEPFHQRMEEVHRELEPIHERMEEVHRRLEEALDREVAAILADELGPVVSASAPLDEATARVTQALSIHIDDGTLRVRAAAGEIQQILTDLLDEHRTVDQPGFAAAAGRAAAAVASIDVRAAR